jgi:hypothetical protein
MRAAPIVVLLLASMLGGCQLLTNFVRPIVDPVDAGPSEDAGEDAPSEDASTDVGR